MPRRNSVSRKISSGALSITKSQNHLLQAATGVSRLIFFSIYGEIQSGLMSVATACGQKPLYFAKNGKKSATNKQRFVTDKQRSVANKQWFVANKQWFVTDKRWFVTDTGVSVAKNSQF
ncbi:MAG TPA: hypothetical protein VMD27_07880 [Candidatus Aquilonibacter sp.]|nr:hypothetical protein [Candidatus Aquilonibacter sp.]